MGRTRENQITPDEARAALQSDPETHEDFDDLSNFEGDPGAGVPILPQLHIRPQKSSIAGDRNMFDVAE